MSRLKKELHQIANQSPQKIKPPIMSKIVDLSVKEILDIEDRSPELIRYDPEYFHVSGIIDACPRALLLIDQAYRNNPKDLSLLESVTGGHKVMWKIGRAVEAHIRDTYNKGIKYEGVYGKWQCKCGAIETVGFYNNDYCNKCNSHTTKYNEYTLFDEESKIVGNPDMILYFKGEYQPVEIKSMNKASWDTLTSPVAKHIVQALFYRLLLQRNGFKVSDKVRFIYCTKDFKFGSPYKEFLVDATTAPEQSVVMSVFNQAIELVKHRARGSLPPREWCETINCTAAKQCTVAGACFA